MADDIERMSVTLSGDLLDRLDRMVDGKAYDSRSEATRDALRTFLTEYQRQQNLEGVQRGVVVVLYDHDTGRIIHELTKLQHDLGDTIVATQHVHLSDHLCMETLAVNGSGTDIQALVEQLRPSKGVHQVKLVVISVD
jgi:CopG family nickel-responsive transcriptional regulator